MGAGVNAAGPYWGSYVALATKHAKSIAVAPEFHERLGAGVTEVALDTDAFGTFTGEVQRRGTAIDTARRKCEAGLDFLGAEYGVASEGSFGSHPWSPLAAIGQDILYFIDRRRSFHLHVHRTCEATNFRKQAIASEEDLERFAAESLFPTHALVVRPNQRNPGEPLHKGITTWDQLLRVYRSSRAQSPDGLAWVETDMRAHVNPTRMSEIRALARKLACRLATPCPACESPGWGMVAAEKGLPCEHCNQSTEIIRHYVLGCVFCDHSERSARHDGLVKAPAIQCTWCNP
ncbi:MAG: hypothetical protein GC168_11080 [Candidatus Hydrogenedens sp.]|nr:hypothetical protein [Candidatus Hydrogenedens sp.]